MNELKKLNEGGTPSERPFLLIYTNKDNVVNYEWLKTKEELLRVMEEVKGHGCQVLDSTLIASCRVEFP